MPIVDHNGNELSKYDVGALQNMIHGSLMNHREVLLDLGYQWHWKGWGENEKRSKEWKSYYTNLSDVCVPFINGLADKIKGYVEGNENLTPEQVIDKVFCDLSTEIMNHWEPQKRAAHKRFIEFATSPTNWACPVIREATGQTQGNTRVDECEQDFNYSTQSFAFSTKPMKQIYEINDFDPGYDSDKSLNKARTKGSTTFDINIDELKAKVDRMKTVPGHENDPEFKADNRKYEKVEKEKTAFDAGIKTSRVCAVNLQKKEHVSFGDLYTALRSLHYQVNGKGERSGKLRGVGVTFSKEKGVSTTTTPMVVYKTLQKIADHMNELKAEPNVALRKTRAVELASFAYQTLLSAHIFSDGNGRTCRLFADTILQTFHLPPHTPPSIHEITAIPASTLGSSPLDYKSGAKCLMYGIQKSNDIVGYEPKKKAEGRQKQIHIITNDTKAYLRVLRDRAQSVRGFFSDSPQYMAFLISLQNVESTVSKILESRKNPGHNEDLAQEAFSNAVRQMKVCAKEYKEYKNQQLNPESGSKKKMNWNDREKIALMDDVLSKRSKPFAKVSTAPKKKTIKNMENNLNNNILS